MDNCILISKYGSVFRTRNDLSGASAAGEQGETEGIIRHLVERYGGDRVIYFGQYRGEPLGCKVVNANLERMKEVGTYPLCVTERMQADGWEDDFDAVSEACGNYAPAGLICVNGYSPTFSHVHNPNGAIVQCAAMNYAAPVLALLENLKIPRICVNNDPRTYPRDQEMSHGWEWARPRAFLDQCSNRRDQVVGGKRYARTSVHARVESWSWLPTDGVPGWHERDHEVSHIVAHAHFTTGIRNGSEEAWDTVLMPGLYGNHVKAQIYGDGWEAYESRTKGFLNGVEFKGPVRPAQVTQFMDWSLCAPVVAHTPGFYTGKPYLMTSRGCVPLLLGSGSHAYDTSRLLDGGPRICEPGDFARLFRQLTHEPTYEHAIAQWREACKPRWELLDQLTDSLMEGTFVEDHAKYGGYARG